MTKINPYQTAQAGWIRYKNKGGLYTAFTVFSIIVSLVITTAASSIGSIFTFNTFFQTTSMALIAGTFGGLLNIGYGHFARADEKGVPVEFGNFLEGFKSDFGTN